MLASLQAARTFESQPLYRIRPFKQLNLSAMVYFPATPPQDAKSNCWPRSRISITPMGS